MEMGQMQTVQVEVHRNILSPDKTQEYAGWLSGLYNSWETMSFFRKRDKVCSNGIFHWHLEGQGASKQSSTAKFNTWHANNYFFWRQWCWLKFDSFTLPWNKIQIYTFYEKYLWCALCKKMCPSVIFRGGTFWYIKPLYLFQKQTLRMTEMQCTKP